MNVESAYEYLKIFKNGAFDSQPLSVQAEVLRLRVRRIVVQEDGVTVEIYGRKPEVLLLGSGRSPKTNTRPDALLGGTRSGVRTDSKLVGATGFEPATFCSRSKRATRLRHAPTL